MSRQLTKCLLGSKAPADMTAYRAANDVNGNPRYVIDYCHFITPKEQESLSVSTAYDLAVGRAKLRFGGKRFHNKQYGGGIVFSSYDLEGTLAEIQAYTKLFEKIQAPYQADK